MHVHLLATPFALVLSKMSQTALRPRKFTSAPNKGAQSFYKDRLSYERNKNSYSHLGQILYFILVGGGIEVEDRGRRIYCYYIV